MNPDKYFDDDRPLYMFCRNCGTKLDLLHAKNPDPLKHYSVWLGCKKCQSVFFFKKYSPMIKTALAMKIMKDFTYDELKDMLSVGVVPDDPETYPQSGIDNYWKTMKAKKTKKKRRKKNESKSRK